MTSFQFYTGLFLISILVWSCEPDEKVPGKYEHILTGSGVMIINEGNFNGGNASLSFYSYDSAKIYSDLFEEINGRPLGDVAQSFLRVAEDKGYVLVNNSNKIEVVNLNTFESVKTINKVASPRYAEKVSSSKVYVTSMYSDSLTIIDLALDKVSGYINLRRSSESILVAGASAFVANWVGGDEVMVINTLTNRVVDSITLSVEPESMVIDKNNVLWVLCNGGWLRENYAQLFAINTGTNEVIRSLQFPTKADSPVNLNCNSARDSLFWLNGGIFAMDISSSSLPEEPLINSEGSYFYKFSVNPFMSEIVVTDALDYSSSGKLYFYSGKGILKESVSAGIIPGNLYFRINENTIAK